MTINFHIQKDVLGLFPELRVFSVMVRGATRSPALIELGTRRLEEAVAHLSQLLPTTEALMGTPLITQWRIDAALYRLTAGTPVSSGLPAIARLPSASKLHRYADGFTPIDL